MHLVGITSTTKHHIAAIFVEFGGVFMKVSVTQYERTYV